MSKPRRGFSILRPLLSLLLVSLGLLTSPAVFAHRDVFTSTYTLGTTKPLQFTGYPSYFQISSTAVYALTVQNGAADGSNRIAKGEIQLGGVIVIPDTELTALAGTISKTITATNSPSLKIILKDGVPGSFIKVTITRHINDTTVPIILLSSPSAEQLFTTTPISVSGNGYDLLDGSTTAYYSDLAEARLNGGTPQQPNPNGYYSFNLALTPGANSYTLTLKDYEGNASTLTRQVWLDSTPPQVTLTSPTAGATVTSAGLTVTGTVTDDTGVTGVKVNGAAATLSGNTFTANVTLSAGANTLTVVATDRAARTTTVTRTVTYNATPLQVSITNPLSGAALDSDTTLVSGTFNGPPNTGVTINGIVAETSGTNFYASNVPLLAGANTLTATATAASGATVTQSITVTSTGKAPTFQINADPQSGIAPLKVKFTVTNNTTAILTKIEADYDGNGVIDFTTGDLNAPIEYTYTTPGVYQANIIVTDNLGQPYTSKHVIVASSVASRDTLLRGVYSNLLANLRAGNIEAALQSVTGGVYEKYKRVFTALKTDLPNVVNNLGTLEDGTISNEMAEYVIARNTADGPQAFLIYFIRGEDGVWRIDGM